MTDHQSINWAVRPAGKGAEAATAKSQTGPVFCVLGPLEVRRYEHTLPIEGVRLQTLLAMFLLHPNRIVSFDSLVEALWPDGPPRTQRQQIYSLVSRLRRILRQNEDLPGEQILTAHPGYILRINPRVIDRELFESYSAEGRRALRQGDPARAVDLLRAAQDLWRGPALEGIDTPSAQAEVVRLEEQRLSVFEDRIEADLVLGRHVELTAELSGLVVAQPLRERLLAQLMLALYRSGRQAEALEAYRKGRRQMVDELGLEPGVELQRLELAILTRDTALAVSRESTGSVGAAFDRKGADGHASGQFAALTPALLPPGVSDFTGRDREVAALEGWLGAAGKATAVPVVVINGKGGVGKTALAVNVAHRLRHLYPDGQLFADLVGPDGRRGDPADPLARFLIALGVPAAAVPSDVELRVQLYRSVLAGRRVLVVLDNALDEAQIHPLLPAVAGSAVLVTSPFPLAGIDGALRLSLDVLDTGPALRLLSAIAGAARTEAEPEAAVEVVRLCGRLPLALRIAGAKLAARPHWSLERFAWRLVDERHRLDELSVADRDVRASIGACYWHLDDMTKSAARKLALLNAPTFAAWVMVPLLDISYEDAERLIEHLVAAQVLECRGEDTAGGMRYRFHELVRLCVREQAGVEEPSGDQRRCLTAALHTWRELGERAQRAMPDGVLFRVRAETGSLGRLDPALAADLLADPLAWFESECAAMVAGIVQAAGLGNGELCAGLAQVIVPFVRLRGYYDIWRDAVEISGQAAERTNEPRVLATAAFLRAQLDHERGYFRAAEAGYEEAHAGFAVAGDRAAMAVSLLGIARLPTSRGGREEAQKARILGEAHELAASAGEQRLADVIWRLVAS